MGGKFIKSLRLFTPTFSAFQAHGDNVSKFNESVISKADYKVQTTAMILNLFIKSRLKLCDALKHLMM